MDRSFTSAVLRGTLWFSLWFAVGSTVLAVGTASEHDVGRRLVLGIVLVTACAAALHGRRPVERALVGAPWLVLVIGAALLIPVVVDGAISNPYLAFCLTSVGIAVIVAPTAWVWLLALVLDIGYAVIVLTSHTPAQLERDGDLGGVIGSFFGCQFAVLILLALRVLIVKFMNERDDALASIRGGGVEVPPKLGQALGVRLTPKEIEAAKLYAQGLKAKQIAYRNGVSVNTVRTHLASAKRKSGARTLRQLAAATADPDWPEIKRLDE